MLNKYIIHPESGIYFFGGIISYSNTILLLREIRSAEMLCKPNLQARVNHVFFFRNPTLLNLGFHNNV